MGPATTILLALLAFARAAPSPVQLDERALSRLQQRERGTRVEQRDVALSLPTDLSSGILPSFEDLPSQDKIKEKLGLNDDQISQLPLQFMNIAGYANYTNSGWNLRIHGLAYKTPNATPEQLDDISSTFISGYDVKNLNMTQLQQSRNMSSAVITLLVGQDQQMMFNLLDQGQPVMGPVKIQTDARGEIDQFVPVTGGNYPADGKRAKKLDLYTQGIDNGNASSYLVPPNGYSLVADIDDILRFTQIYQPTNGLDNSFANPFIPWANMPEIMNGWANSDPDLHFHYLTTTPEQFTRIYEDFIFKYFPAGSFDIRPLNFTTVDQIFAVRNVSLVKFFETFPTRKIVLMADTSNSDVMKDYPQMAHSFPNQVACILLRNTSATDDDKFPYDTSGFKGLDQSKYMFFRTTDDIRNLKFSNGDCYNSSVPQNVTFDTQGGPFSAAPILTIPRGGLVAALVGTFIGALLVV